MVKEGIILGHRISEKGIEVDRAKVEVIETSSTHLCKRCEEFPWACGFQSEVHQGFFKIVHPLCKLLEKECKFYFDESFLNAFGELKEKLVSAPIIISPDWSEPFEVMCHANGVSLGVVLAQIRDKILHPIYYASKSLN